MTKPPKPRYSRILLKLSGEAVGGESGIGICPESIHDMAHQIGEVRELGVEVVIVVGGGNIFRGLTGSERGIERATGDYMGMLATIINALALQDALEKNGDRKSTRLNSSHVRISYAVFCLKKKKKHKTTNACVTVTYSTSHK